MPEPIQRIVVLGGGTAGLLSSMALKRAFPQLNVVTIHSPAKPVIGVGESTTVLFPPFLHSSLGLPRDEFFRAVRPSWKLGIRFIWGDPRDSHFNYPFDKCMSRQPATLSKMPAYYCLHEMSDASRYSAMMDRGLAPCALKPDGKLAVDEGGGYHIENHGFINFLISKVSEFGVQLISGELGNVIHQASGDVEALVLRDGRKFEADVFLDCSGFNSLLLGSALGESFFSYADSLPCDMAVVGTWKRRKPVLPYTTAETMDNGWCWRIDFPEHVSRGYVFCTRFCSQEEAAAEMRDKNPQLDDDLRVIKFRSGRRENFWVRNVVAMGNASGFVEPLEATALHMLVEQIRLFCRVLSESDGRLVPTMRDVSNQRFRLLWDEVRDFLAIHFRFNRRSDSPFWRFCRENVNLAGAAKLVEFYQQVGPSTLSGGLLPSGRLFGYDGFMTLLIGQRIPTAYQGRMSTDDQQRWESYRRRIRQEISQTLPMEIALNRVYSDLQAPLP